MDEQPSETRDPKVKPVVPITASFKNARLFSFIIITVVVGFVVMEQSKLNDLLAVQIAQRMSLPQSTGQVIREQITGQKQPSPDPSQQLREGGTRYKRLSDAQKTVA